MKTNTMLGAQLYTLREYLKTPEEIESTLKKVKEMGYDTVQLSGLGPIEPARLKEILDGLQLKAVVTHIGFKELTDQIDSVVEKHKLWDCKYVGLGSMPKEYRDSKEGYQSFAKIANEIGRKLSEHGLYFVYHNHAFEFRRFDGKPGLEILFDETNPEYVGFEIDTYWVQAGGADPAAWLRKMKGRVDVIHYKDMTVDAEGKPEMAEVGEGNMNWQEINKACEESGVKWIMVEQDRCQRSPFESLAISLKNLHAMGLK